MSDVNPAVKRRIDNYTLDAAGANWPVLRSFVAAIITSLNPRTPDVASHYLGTAAKFIHWAWQSQGVELDLDEIFRLDLVAMFNEQQMSGHSDTYRAQTAQRLNALVAHVSGVAPPRETRSAHIAAVYSDQEILQLRGAALAHTTDSRRANAHILLGLGAGAGLRTEEVALARVGDISFRSPLATVNIRGKYTREVPVKSRWVPYLLKGLGDRDPESWAFTGYRLPEYPARVIHQFGIDTPGIPTASVTRLRATWIVGLLDDGLPVDLVLRLAWLAQVVSLAGVVEAMRPHTVEEYLSTIIGEELAR